MRCFRFAVVTLLLASRAMAEVPLVAPADIKLIPPLAVLPPGDDKIVALRLKEPAPFDGQLFDQDTAIRWGMWLQQWEERYKADMAREKNLCRVNASYQSGVSLAAAERAKTVEKDLNERLLRSEAARVKAEYELYHPGFFASSGFYYGLGVVTTGALVGLSIWAVKSAR